MHIIVKGGVWKNTEDEILKAAVSKYGLNQWARISSLLVRKTPKQCKARWYEWLDPAIRKTEWSREEDERLLHLAKIFPTQWRTIAPMVGRTPTQCLQRYQHLLDEAEARDNEALGLIGVEEHGPSADDVRKLRPGEQDPDPETKPARPDPVDMDEDEKEMLSEARARLANTQGKKAKRKAREKQLEEARRLALLQKRRELKAAGINVRISKKKRGMDYNADIPFEKQPTLGFYDTTEEKYKQQVPITSANIKQMERKRGAESQQDGKKRQKKDKDGNGETPLTAAQVAMLEKQMEAEQIGRRRTLNLPAPQVGQAELEDIVKIGQSGESTRDLVDQSGNELSLGLLAEYDMLAAAKDIRTPQVGNGRNVILDEARNLRLMTEVQTPLLGQEATPMRGVESGYDGLTPRRTISSTPNPLAVPVRNEISSATPFRTPRDQFKLNVAARSMVGVNETPRDLRLRDISLKQSLKQRFLSLPKPQNSFEIVEPDHQSSSVEDRGGTVVTEEDASDRDRRIQQKKEAEEKARLARRSLAVQKGLPRPVSVDDKHLLSVISEGDDEDSRIQLMIDEEMIKLLVHDAAVYPVKGAAGTSKKAIKIDTFDDNSLNHARLLVQEELERISTRDESSENVEAIFYEIWKQANKDYAYSPSLKRFVPSSEITEADKIDNLKREYEVIKAKIAFEAQRATKAENKLNRILGVYIDRASTVSESLNEKFDRVNSIAIETDSFRNLSISESEAIPRRIQMLEKEVLLLVDKESALQKRYVELMEEKQSLLESSNAM